MSKKPIVILILILAGTAAVGYAWLKQRPPAERTELLLYGNMDLRHADLAFDESARITKIYVQTGDRVVSGQPLALLDTRRYQNNLDAALAAQQASQAALDRLLAGSRPQDIERLRGVVEADSANLKTRQLSYARTAKLIQQKMASIQSGDEARAARDAAAGQLKADQAALDLAIIGPRKEDIDQARANLTAAQTQVNAAQIALTDTVLKAPSPGTIQNRILEPGDMASPAQPVLTLALTEPHWARVYVDEQDIGRIKEGMTATLSSDSFPGKYFQGWIGYISPTAEFTPKTVESPAVRTDLVYQARIYACDPNANLRLGMPVTVTISFDAKIRDRGQNPCSAPSNP
ncbi:efflux RND transporter periplasmic adaptor subunit [Halothiobacillus sp.]|uniref:efflux RND transporter periplasmic adaptor subunit n=1 Tax=Halothiobacillus sp. TaxID=1891311 RepID=UPI002AD4248A|nr:efflux RND transporter periplasmic adaptor subunit [Halothiobacillus sp.]